MNFKFIHKQLILDHGYLEYVTHCGSDELIIDAARMSVDRGFVSWEPYEGHPKGDLGLLSYLRENRHTTPFEMGTIIIKVQAPIMVFREWHRHRTQSFNEMSARYTPLPDVNYIPTVERLMLNSGKGNKQAGTIKDAKELTVDRAESFRLALLAHASKQQSDYEWALRVGVPKELARCHLGVFRYSRMMASANLKNWLDFMTLRSDTTRQGKKAQYEIRQYANALAELIATLFPKTWQLFYDSNQEKS